MNMTAETRADMAKVLTDAAIAIMTGVVSHASGGIGFWSLTEPKPPNSDYATGVAYPDRK